LPGRCGSWSSIAPERLLTAGFLIALDVARAEPGEKRRHATLFNTLPATPDSHVERPIF
jgi:hypothetical protein